MNAAARLMTNKIHAGFMPLENVFSLCVSAWCGKRRKSHLLFCFCSFPYMGGIREDETLSLIKEYEKDTKKREPSVVRSTL